MCTRVVQMLTGAGCPLALAYARPGSLSGVKELVDEVPVGWAVLNRSHAGLQVCSNCCLSEYATVTRSTSLRGATENQSA